MASVTFFNTLNCCPPLRFLHRALFFVRLSLFMFEEIKYDGFLEPSERNCIHYNGQQCVWTRPDKYMHACVSLLSNNNLLCTLEIKQTLLQTSRFLIVASY